MSIIGKCCCRKYSFCIPQEFIKFGFASCHCSICRSSHGSPFVLWSGIKAEHREHFKLLLKDSSLNGLNEIKGSLSQFRTSADCVRYFCGTCGTHLFIDYEKDDSAGGEKKSPWEDEIHFPTALLDNESLGRLEEAVRAMNKPRYLHVFYSDRSVALGDLSEWAKGPKYGGVTGLEPIN
eukprot:gene639-681_t